MSVPLLSAGKLPESLLREVLGEGPPLPPEVLVGPKVGEDGCVIAMSGGELVVATDPITLAGSAVGAHAVAVNANDVAVMGVQPRWFLATVLLPVGTTEHDVRALFREMRKALATAEVALVGGHTEVTAAVTQTIVVGQMLGLAPPGGAVATGGLRAGDRVLQIGAAPIEGAAILADVFASRLDGIEPGLIGQARQALEQPGISVVGPAILAARQGASSLHDPTEGGLSAGLFEMASASGLDLRVYRDAVQWFEPGVVLCDALGADPWGMLASGALLAGFPPDKVDAAWVAFGALGVPVAWVAEACRATGPAGAGGGNVVFDDGQPVPKFSRDELARLLDPVGGVVPESGG